MTKEAQLNFGATNPIKQNKLVAYIRRNIPAKLHLSIRHYKKIGRWPNIRKPITFNEHILHRAFIEKPEISAFVDKAQAREKVSQMLGDSFVPTRYLLTKDANLPWDNLPDRFVVSATHGSSMTMVVGDKASLDKVKATKIFQSWLDFDFASDGKESIYRNIVPQLLVEENISSSDGQPPSDYKFLCFAGEPHFIQLDIGRYKDHKRIIYNTNWEPMDFQSNRAKKAGVQPKPKQFDDMLAIARKLSQGFDYVRVDLYAVGENRIVFGEWTFVPGAGCEPYEPDEQDYILGDLYAKAKEQMNNKH